jgi:MHS family proline/betaine transporter-like MFS transporter
LADPRRALVAACIGNVVDETPRFRAVQRARAVARWPVREVIWTYPGRVLVGFGLIVAASLSFNTFFIYLPSQLATELEIPLPRALAGALLGLAVMATLSPALGRVSDRLGRKPLLVAATLGLLALTVPVYLLVRQGGPGSLALGYLLIGVALSGFVLPTLLSELFPTRLRSSALSITYGWPAPCSEAAPRS